MRTYKTLPTNPAFFENYATLTPTLYRLGFLAQIVSALTEISIIYAIVYSSLKDFTPAFAPIIAGAGAFIGTAFIEVGLRKLTPYSIRAILNRRFAGLHLAMSIFILVSTAALLTTSGVLSFKNSKSIVEAMAPAPEQRTTATAQTEYQTRHAEIWATFRTDSAGIAQRLNADTEAQRKRFAALVGVERAKLAEVEAKERRSNTRYPTQRGKLRTRIAELEAQQDGVLATLQGEAGKELAELRKARTGQIRGIEAALTTEKQRVEQFNAEHTQKAEGKVDKYGGGLAWFTVICLCVFVFSVVLDEVHHKGSGIKETVEPTQYDFLPGVFGELNTALNERFNFVFRNQIRRFANATPAPPLPLPPAPLYDIAQMAQPRFVVHPQDGTDGPQQIYLNGPAYHWQGGQVRSGSEPSGGPDELEAQILGYCKAAQTLKGGGMEREAREMELRATDVIRLYLGPEATPAAVEDLRQRIIAHLDGNGPNPFEHLHRRPIGFNLTSTDTANGERSTVNVERGTRNCQHCGIPFEKKHWNARYCSDGCRVEAWEKRTGGKVQMRGKPA